MSKEKLLREWLEEEPSQGEVELGKGERNSFFEFVLKFRELMIEKGFREINLPVMESKHDVMEQRKFGFYVNDGYLLAEPTRYYSLSLEDLKEILPDATEAVYKKVLDVFEDYSKGKIHARDLPRALVARAGLLIDQAILVCNKAVPPRARTGKLMVRNFFASSWLIGLRHLYKRYPSPQAYFTIGMAFDPLSEKVKGRYHLSGVIVGNTSVSQMVKIVKELLAEFNVSPEIVRDVTGDTLFIPNSFHSISSKGVKMGYVAQLSFTSLEYAGIDEPVVMFDLDLLSTYRAMGKEPLSDLYPYLFGEWYLPDEEIAKHLEIREKPTSLLGREILVALRKNAELYASQPAPCEFKVYEKEFEEKALEVWIIGYEKSLVGPGFNNEIIVYKGSILALPTTGDHEALLNGVRTGIKLGDALANYVAAEIEKDPLRPREFKFDVTSIENANIHIPKQVQEYIKHIGADINLEAPVYFKVEARIRKLWVYRKGQ